MKLIEINIQVHEINLDGIGALDSVSVLTGGRPVSHVEHMSNALVFPIHILSATRRIYLLAIGFRECMVSVPW